MKPFFILILLSTLHSTLYGLDLENDSDSTEESFEDVNTRNHIQYKVLTTLKNHSSLDQFRLEQSYKSKVKIRGTLLRPHTDPKQIYPSLGIEFKCDQFKVTNSFLTHPSKNLESRLGLEYKYNRTPFRNKISISSQYPAKSSRDEIITAVESHYSFLEESELLFFYKNGSTHHWGIALMQEFQNSGRIQVEYEYTLEKKFKTECDWDLNDDNQWRLTQTYWENKNSKWSLQYSHISNPKFTHISKIEWTNPPKNQNNSLGVAQALQLNISRQIKLSGGIKVEKNPDIPTNLKNQFLQIQIKNENFLKMILEWRSYDTEDYKNRLQLVLEYGWN